MFSALRQGSALYVLDTKGKPTLRKGMVQSVSAPKYQQFTMSPEMTVDITVKFDDGETNEYKQMPSALSVASMGNIIIAESRELMSQEVENILRNSKNIIDHVDYHKEVVAACEQMLVALNPSFAKEKETDERLSKLEGGLEDIKTMLARALNPKK